MHLRFGTLQRPSGGAGVSLSDDELHTIVHAFRSTFVLFDRHGMDIQLGDSARKSSDDAAFFLRWLQLFCQKSRTPLFASLFSKLCDSAEAAVPCDLLRLNELKFNCNRCRETGMPLHNLGRHYEGVTQRGKHRERGAWLRVVDVSTQCPYCVESSARTNPRAMLRLVQHLFVDHPRQLETMRVHDDLEAFLNTDTSAVESAPSGFSFRCRQCEESLGCGAKGIVAFLRHVLPPRDALAQFGQAELRHLGENIYCRTAKEGENNVAMSESIHRVVAESLGAGCLAPLQALRDPATALRPIILLESDVERCFAEELDSVCATHFYKALWRDGGMMATRDSSLVSSTSVADSSGNI